VSLEALIVKPGLTAAIQRQGVVFLRLNGKANVNIADARQAYQVSAIYGVDSTTIGYFSVILQSL